MLPLGGSLGFGFAVGFGVALRLRLRISLRVGLRVAFRLGLRISLRVGLRGAFRVALLLRRLLRAALEIGGVPTRPLQLEAGRGKLLAVLGLAACRADAERRFGHLLQVLLLVAAGIAAVVVDRHAPRLYR